MLYINCPHCGMRSQNEFSYGGDASVKRPELNTEISDIGNFYLTDISGLNVSQSNAFRRLLFSKEISVSIE